MKNYFYCNSYQAFFMALNISTEKNPVTILTSKKDIAKVCEDLELPIINLKNHSIKEIIVKSKKINTLIKSVCKTISNGCLHFSHTQFDVFCFLLINEYAKKHGLVKFYNFELVINSNERFLFTKRFFKILIFKWIINSSYKTNLIIKIINKRPLFAIDNNFFFYNKIDIIDNKTQFYNIVYRVSQKNKINVGPIEVLFLGQNLLNSTQISTPSIINLYQYLNNYNIVVKHHPYMSEEKIFESKFQVPLYLPAELLFGNVVKSVISINSVALITASRYAGIKAISLMNLLTINDLKLSTQIRELLTQESKGRIFFPNSFEELDKLLS